MNDKPITMIIEETKTKLATVCNESQLPPVVLDLILQGIYYEIHAVVEKQTQNDKLAYMKSLANTEKVKNNETEG